jgi:3D (Asp-Asp-Asp) domain-containing protein
MRLSASLLLFALLATRSVARADMAFTATAYSTPGITTKGNTTKAGTAAADPAIIPLGSLVRVRRAGRYSGLYVVTDTGPSVTGRVIDLYIPNQAQAKKFGKKRVRVRIIKPGDNVKGKPETAPKVPPGELAPAVKPAPK